MGQEDRVGVTEKKGVNGEGMEVERELGEDIRKFEPNPMRNPAH